MVKLLTWQWQEGNDWSDVAEEQRASQGQASRVLASDRPSWASHPSCPISQHAMIGQQREALLCTEGLRERAGI